jgi:hypothetical protein
MSRKLMAVLLSSALTFGSVTTSAWSATNAPATIPAQSVQTGDQARNQPPLPPAGAAGIEEAQGLLRAPILTIAIVAGVVALVWILLDDDDDSSSGTE